MPGTVYDRKGDALIRIEFTDHLQHQQLVEIGIEQAAHDRIEAPAMINGSGSEIGHCHCGTLSFRGPPNQWVLAGTWQLSALFLPDSGDRRLDTCPGRLFPGELSPQGSAQ